jgi:hypothetical protein
MTDDGGISNGATGTMKLTDVKIKQQESTKERMMIYIIFENQPDDRIVKGVYTTNEKAKSNLTEKNELNAFRQRMFTIEEHEVIE